ncbi:MAG: hypothetical protein J6V15_04275 [Clostridia bacterium]|nr:hypothetical protein [Clostridia bacterium]
MIEKDTIRLLRECDAGVKMGVDSIDSVIDRVKSRRLKSELNRCKDEHEQLRAEIGTLLNRFGDDGKEPAAIALGMSHLKTNMKMMHSPADKTVADLMTDGCNMGVKSLSKYLNEYKAASEQSKDIAKRLIGLEEGLARQLRDFL